MSLEIPQIDNCCDKETYAFYGLAAYAAQVLEHSALNIAVALKLPEVNLVTQELFDEIFENFGRKTFGQILNILRPHISMSESEEIYLREALELRNILIHHFFRENAENFISKPGRAEMINQLQSIISKFQKADEILEKIYLPLWEKFGVTEGHIQAQLEEMRLKALAKEQEAQAVRDVEKQL